MSKEYNNRVMPAAHGLLHGELMTALKDWKDPDGVLPPLGAKVVEMRDHTTGYYWKAGMKRAVK